VSYQEWRKRLQDVVDDGLRDLKAAQVIAALGAEVGRAGRSPRPRSPEPTPAQLVVPVPVLGVDACAGGWVGVLLQPARPAQVLMAEAIGGVVELARESVNVEVVAIDIPIGLPDAGRRQADQLARKAVPGKSSSVFTTLVRRSWEAESRAAADEISRSITGMGVPAHTWALRDKLLQVDDWLRTRPPLRVVEIHPEVTFAEIAGAPVLPSKHTPEGLRDRRAVLAGAGMTVPPFYRGQGHDEDDLLDACAAAWTALRCAAGTARSLPEVPEVFSDGLPAAIWV
jgi:predicted RNase H-like nuclease